MHSLTFFTSNCSSAFLFWAHSWSTCTPFTAFCINWHNVLSSDDSNRYRLSGSRSTFPRMRLAMQGRPAAIASIKATGSPSCLDGNTKVSAHFSNSYMSFRKPSKCALSDIPSSLIKAVKCSFSLPLPQIKSCAPEMFDFAKALIKSSSLFWIMTTCGPKTSWSANLH